MKSPVVKRSVIVISSTRCATSELSPGSVQGLLALTALCGRPSPPCSHPPDDRSTKRARIAPRLQSFARDAGTPCAAVYG